MPFGVRPDAMTCRLTWIEPHTCKTCGEKLNAPMTPQRAVHVIGDEAYCVLHCPEHRKQVEDEW